MCCVHNREDSFQKPTGPYYQGASENSYCAQTTGGEFGAKQTFRVYHSNGMFHTNYKEQKIRISVISFSFTALELM